MIETSEKLELAQNPPAEVLAETEQPQKKSSRFTKKKSKKKKIIIGLVIAAAVIAGSVVLFLKKDGMLPVDSIALKKQAISNMVSVTGTVESAQAVRVYSNLGSEVNSINVKVGDQVNEGDVLAQMDTADLVLTIAQQQATMNQTAKANEHSIEVSEKKLQNAQSNIKNKLDAELLGTENALRSAEQNLNDARHEYNDAKDVRTDADEELTKAEKAYYKAEEEYLTAKKKSESDPSDAALKADYDAKEKVYDAARSALINAESDVTELSKQRVLYRQARVAYENALSSKQAAENSTKQTLDSYKDNITATEISADQTANHIALQKLQKQLSDSTLTAPISGTVTAVYAKVGAPGSGLMFLIENTDDLVIKTKIKEYDITTVKEGMTATVKSDATGDKEFEGKIERIYPTAIKAEDGSTKAGGKVEFESDVAIVSKDSGLRVGMNVRLNIVTAQKENVYAVPYEAVTTDEQGQKVIYVAKANEENKMIANVIPVTTGMETDFYIEINSDSLADGDIVLTNPIGIIAGSEVMLSPEVGAAGGVEGVASTGESAARG